MIGSIIGGAMKLAGGIAGGISASKAARQQNKRINEQMEENQDWFDRRYNEDATQRADAQRLLTITEERIKNRNRQAEGAAAVMGGSTESVAAAKAANNAALTDTVSNIAASAADRKDAIEQQYLGNKANLNQQLNALSREKAQNITKAIGGVANAAADIASAEGLYDNIGQKATAQSAISPEQRDMEQARMKQEADAMLMSKGAQQAAQDMKNRIKTW